jgi:hypothetical protein
MRMHELFGEQFHFYLVYIREAHAEDEWTMPANDDGDIRFFQPETLEERCEIASTCIDRMSITLPTIVDGIDDPTMTPYGGWPERIYVIDEAGRITYQGEQGPWGFSPIALYLFLNGEYGIEGMEEWDWSDDS